MNITVKKQPDCSAILHVEFPPDIVNSERDRILKNYSQAKIQGYRPGKVPRKIIEKRFEDPIREELRDRLFRQGCDEALQKEAIKVLNFGLPDDFSENADGSVSFKSVLTLAPEFELPDFKGIAVKAPALTVSEEELDERLKSIGERFPEHKDVDELAAKLADGKNVEEFKELVREQIRQEERRKIDEGKTDQIVAHFDRVVDFDLPEELVYQETQNQANVLAQRALQSGMSQEELADQQGEFLATADEKARTTLKTNFIFQEIASVENLVVSDQELISYLGNIARQRKEEPKKFIKQLEKEGRIAYIRNSMLISKAIAFVLEHADVEEVPGVPVAVPVSETPDKTSIDS
jgi:FKBP-type peptidyl-prolyl cis-trans isomerase (trigger factor)